MQSADPDHFAFNSHLKQRLSDLRFIRANSSASFIAEYGEWTGKGLPGEGASSGIEMPDTSRIKLSRSKSE
jgi:hypothetical protein